MLQSSGVEAAQHPANNKSRRFVCIGTSSKTLELLPGADSQAEAICGRKGPALREDITAALCRIWPGT
jgi:hypothetical protein